MAPCGNCSGNCGSCSGCGGSLVMTETELTVLQSFADLPFQPILRKPSQEQPVSPEAPTPERSLVL